MSYEQERQANRLRSQVHTLKIETRVPSKWRMVDMETGDVWKWEVAENRYVRASDLAVADPGACDKVM